jgi:tetratricopeptide (TPR) repeat protein
VVAQNRTAILSALILLFLAVSGCALPKVMVLRDPLSADERLTLGMGYEKSGNYEDAIREYRMASVKLPIAHLFMGNSYFLLHDYVSAEESYRTAIAKLPEHPHPLNNLAWMYLTLGIKLPEAEELALKALSLSTGEEKIALQDTLDRIRKKSR